MTRHHRRVAGALVALAVSSVIFAPGAGADPEAQRPRLRAADPYAVIADQTISSTGATVINGNVAIAATDDLSGFPPGTIIGETHLADQEALDAAGATAAVNQDLKSQPCNSDRSGEDMGGLRLSGAVYCYNEPATLDGELRFDALQDRDEAWVIQINGTFDVAPGSEVILANGAQACGVFWQVTGTVTIGAGATFKGTIVSDDNIIVEEGASVDGRLFAPQGTVLLANNTIAQSACLAGNQQVTTTTTPTATTTTTAVPDPGATTTLPTPTTTPGSGDGSGSDSGDGTGTGSGSGDGTGGDGSGGDDDGLAVTGPVSMVVVAMAISALGVGHALVGTERVVAWNKRRWRPRHAERRGCFDRFR